MNSEENERTEEVNSSGAEKPTEQPIVAKLADEGRRDDLAETPDSIRTSAIDGDDFGLAGPTSNSGDAPVAENPPETVVLTEQQRGEQQVSDQEVIRVGSPFRCEPSPITGTAIRLPRAKSESFYDVGPLRYTAMGAVAAAILVLGFAAAAAWWFPGGGTLIAALGCALSVFGLYSNKKIAAGGCLLMHLLLFMISYSRAIEI